MARTLLYSEEIALPTNAGSATSFSQAPLVRLVNTDTSAHTVIVLETQSGPVIGSMTMPANTVELLEKQLSYVIYADSATVKGSKVGFTGN